jgi:hypothetical protein
MIRGHTHYKKKRHHGSHQEHNCHATTLNRENLWHIQGCAIAQSFKPSCKGKKIACRSQEISTFRQVIRKHLKQQNIDSSHKN